MQSTELGATLLGRIILCTAMDFSNACRCSTTGSHNAQRITAYGSKDMPAYAVINVPIINYKKIKTPQNNTFYEPYDEIKGDEIIGIFEKHHFPKRIGENVRATFKANPARAIVNKKIKWIEA